MLPHNPFDGKLRTVLKRVAKQVAKYKSRISTSEMANICETVEPSMFCMSHRSLIHFRHAYIHFPV